MPDTKNNITKNKIKMQRGREGGRNKREAAKEMLRIKKDDAAIPKNAIIGKHFFI